MGHGVCVECKNCGGGEEFIFGVGMAYHSLPNVISCVQGGARKKVEDIMQNHNVLDGEFEHRLYACPKCNTLHGRFYVRLEYDDGIVYEIPFRCGQCRTLLVDANEDDVESYTCKECGKQTLVRGAEMLWD